MKTISISIINRVIIFILAIILTSVLIADVLHTRYTKELLESVNSLEDNNENVSLVEANISELYKAENNFRLYVATYDKSYFYSYFNSLKKIQTSILELQKQYASLQSSIADSSSIDATFRRKILINSQIADLKNIIDSSLSAALILQSMESSNSVPSYPKGIKIKQNKIDSTFITQKNAKKKGFLERVKTLFSDTPDKDTITINNISATTIEQDSVNILVNAAVKSVEDYYKNYLNSQMAARRMLNSKDKELVLLNFSLIEKLETMLHQFRAQVNDNQQLNKQKAISVVHHTTNQLSYINNFLIIVFIILTLLISYNIYQVNLHAQKLLKARKDAEYKTIAKSNLMASVSHEIRNPLTVIRGFTELLYKSKLPEEQHEQIKTIKSASDILLSTVNDILDFSKLEAGRMILQMAPFQPQKLVDEVFLVMKSLPERKGLVLKTATDQMPPTLSVMGDAFRLKQMLINLISNATKFTEHGTITMTVSAEKQTNTNNKIIVTFAVQDSGIGIPANKIKDVFNKFEQVNTDPSNHTGTGLGLAICRKIVQLHGGSIEVTSDLGKGSVFTAIIPFTPATVQAVPMEVEPNVITNPTVPISSKLKNKQILLVDDNPLILQLAELILQKHGAIVTKCEDGSEAWKFFQEQHFDLVLTDINLPGLSGMEIAKNIRSLSLQKKANTPILALTGDIFKDDIEKYSAAGFNNFIIKPFEEKVFLTEIEHYFK